MARYKKYKRGGKKNKYNINSFIWQGIPATAWYRVGQSGTVYYANQEIVPASSVGGTRKVKRFIVNMAAVGTLNVPVFWALVYVPEGVTLSPGGISGEGIQPTQYVIAQGMLTNLTPVRLNSPMSRNLNQNDKIMLILWTDFGAAVTAPAPISGYTQYAICYN